MRHFARLLILFPLLLALGAAHRVHAQAPVYGYEVVNSFPHDTKAFTQGLILHDGNLYESTGLYGSSSLRQVKLTTGEVLRKIDVPAQYFAEGMTIFQGQIFQLTWQSQTGFIYDPATFNQIGQFYYPGEGWGLTHDAQHLIMSDGTSQIRFLDPVTFQLVRSISVFSNGSPLTQINELEYINGEIYANIWQTNWIVRIDPESGAVLGWIDLTGLLPPGTSADVLNGIAYEPVSGHLLVTGKFWPWLFEIKMVGNAAPVAASQSVSTPEDTARGISLSGSDADGDALIFQVVTVPTHGTLGGSAPNLVYTPAANYNGSDSFTFIADDGLAVSSLATVSISISPVNDAPMAAPDTYSASVNTPLLIAAPGILTNDTDVDGDPLSAFLVSGPSHGTLTLSVNGAFSYTPSPNYTGPDSFTYHVRDAAATSNAATVSLSITGSTPAVSLSPSSLSFGNQVVGTTSVVRTITLTNSGNGPLSIGSVTVTGANAGDFTQTNNCGSSVAPGASGAINVTFRPTSTGQRRAAISISDNAAGSPHVIPLNGSGKKSSR
jgi:glutamine cyclotransferase